MIIKFLNDHQVLIFALLKSAVMLGFALQIAPLLVFGERRQSAMIQDRVGPNRAAVAVPGTILKGALATPALLLAVAVLALCFGVWPPKVADGIGVTRGFWLGELGIFLAWSNALVLAGYARNQTTSANGLEAFFVKEEDPRWIFYTGLALHALFFVLEMGFAPGGPTDAVLAFGGPVILALALFAIGGYLGYRIPSGRIELRAAGLFHSIADTVKFAMKEDFIPTNADRLLHTLAPIIALVPPLATLAVIPFGGNVCFEATPEGLTNFAKISETVSRAAPCAHGVSLQIADLNIGIIYMFAIAGTGVIGAAIAGWSSDNKFGVLGGLRATSQMVSYEVAIGLSLVGAFMIYGTPRLGEMVAWQDAHAWGIFVQPFSFFLFFAATIAEQKRTPFDAPEGESEIVAGYFIEYSSMKFIMFYTGEYIEMVSASALLVTIFLGGYTMPFLHRDGVEVVIGGAVLWKVAMSHLAVTILQVLIFFGKTTILSFGQIFIRWTLPRFRYDQIMAFGWKFLLPISLGNVVVTGLGILLAGQGGESVQSTLRLLADVSNAVVWIAVGWLLWKLARLMLAPVDRKQFVASTSATAVAQMGGVKDGPMQALGRTIMGNGIVGKPVRRPPHGAAVGSYLPAILSGMGVTMKHFFKNTKEMAFGQRNDPVLEAFDEGVTTISYPEQKRPYPERFRGLHRLTLRDDGAPRCVACLCCSTACPAQCIHIVAGEYGDGDKREGYERYPVEFVIDELRCIFCGYCVEACPCDAIRMDTGQHPVPYDSREQFIYKKDLLMSFSDTHGKQLSENPRHEPADGFPITREHGHLAISNLARRA